MWLRLKADGMRVIMIEVSHISSFEIKIVNDTTYRLLASVDNDYITLVGGNFMSCHTMLNSIIDSLCLEEEIIDLDYPDDELFEWDD